MNERVELPRLGFLAWIPGFATLGLGLWLRVGIPEPLDSVWFRLDSELPYHWGEVLEGRHACYFAFRALYMALVSTGLDFAWLGLAPWLAALLTFLACRRLTRRLAPTTPPRSLWATDLLLALWLFHPMWGQDWLLAGRVREFLPLLGVVMAAGTLAGTKGRFGARSVAALAWTCFAIAAGPTGLLAWLALGPAVLATARRDRAPSPGRATVTFVGWGALFHLVVWYGFRQHGTPGLLAYCEVAPVYVGLMATHIVAPLEPIQRLNPSLFGLVVCVATMILTLTAALRRPQLSPRGGTALTLALFGLCVVVSTLDQYFLPRGAHGYVPANWIRESTIGIGALFAGLLGLVRELYPRIGLAVTPILLGAGIGLLVSDQPRGFFELRRAHDELRTRAAELAIDAAAPDRRLIPRPQPDMTLPHAILDPAVRLELRARGMLQVLRQPIDLDALPTQIDDTCGELRPHAGQWRARVHLTKDGVRPDLVLLLRTRQDLAQVVATLRPATAARPAEVLATGPRLEALDARPGDLWHAVGCSVQPFRTWRMTGHFVSKAGGALEAAK